MRPINVVLALATMVSMSAISPAFCQINLGGIRAGFDLGLGIGLDGLTDFQIAALLNQGALPTSGLSATISAIRNVVSAGRGLSAGEVADISEVAAVIVGLTPAQVIAIDQATSAGRGLTTEEVNSINEAAASGLGISSTLLTAINQAAITGRGLSAEEVSTASSNTSTETVTTTVAPVTTTETSNSTEATTTTTSAPETTTASAVLRASDAAVAETARIRAALAAENDDLAARNDANALALQINQQDQQNRVASEQAAVDQAAALNQLWEVIFAADAANSAATFQSTRNTVVQRRINSAAETQAQVQAINLGASRDAQIQQAAADRQLARLIATANEALANQTAAIDASITTTVAPEAEATSTTTEATTTTTTTTTTESSPAAEANTGALNVADLLLGRFGLFFG